EADAPHADVRLGKQREAIHGAHVQSTVRLEDTRRVRDECVGVEAVLQRAEGDDAPEGPIAKGEMLAVAAHQWSAHPRALQTPTRHDEPPERDVDADHPLSASGSREHEVGGPTADVEPPTSRRLAGQ